MKHKPFYIVYFICCCLVAVEAWAGDLKLETKADGLYVDNATVESLKKLFVDYDYQNYVRKSQLIPPIFVKKIPSDFNEIKSKDKRNMLFIMIISPLALKVNEEIILERAEILQIRDQFKKDSNLSEEQKQRLETLAKKYDVFTRIKDKPRYTILLSRLMVKIDKIPPALLIAAAAAESNWGTAREVKLGNSLYKMKNWYSDEGIKPLDDDDDYRLRTYDNLLDSIRDYALKLNSDINFQFFRTARKQQRARSPILKGRTNDYNMVVGSPLENYAGLINYILTFYDLVNVDMSKLDSLKNLEKK